MTSHPLIYLDHNATTPVDARVLDAMLPYFREVYGNPGNALHAQGRRAHQAVQHSRNQIAAFLGCSPNEIIFTSGATESNNLAILGLQQLARQINRNVFITCAVEHKAVLAPCAQLRSAGFETIILPVNSQGQIELNALQTALSSQTLLVSIQAANNETGVIQPLREIAEIAHAAGALLHSDATQAVGKIPLNVSELEIDLLSFSGHKLYAPKGIGGLYIRGGLSAHLTPLVYGGGQERELRPGTLNVPGIVGLGMACEIAAQDLPEESSRLQRLRDLLESGLQNNLPGLKINSQQVPRLPNTSSLTFPSGIDADALLLNLPELMLGVGSACNAGAPEPSHVLQALGLTRPQARATVRASLGRLNTRPQIERAVEQITQATRQLLNLSVG